MVHFVVLPGRIRVVDDRYCRAEKIRGKSKLLSNVSVSFFYILIVMNWVKQSLKKIPRKCIDNMLPRQLELNKCVGFLNKWEIFINQAAWIKLVPYCTNSPGDVNPASNTWQRTFITATMYRAKPMPRQNPSYTTLN